MNFDFIYSTFLDTWEWPETVYRGLAITKENVEEPWKINMAFFLSRSNFAFLKNLVENIGQEPLFEQIFINSFRFFLIETHHTKKRQQSDEEWEKLLSGGLMNFSLALVYLLRGIWEVSFNVSFSSAHSRMSIRHI